MVAENNSRPDVPCAECHSNRKTQKPKVCANRPADEHSSHRRLNIGEGQLPTNKWRSIFQSAALLSKTLISAFDSMFKYEYNRIAHRAFFRLCGVTACDAQPACVLDHKPDLATNKSPCEPPPESNKAVEAISIRSAHSETSLSAWGNKRRNRSMS